MAYYTGTANSLSDLRTALLTHAQADGWALTGNVLSKSGVFFEITVDALNIKCLGVRDNALSTPAPNVVSIGRIFTRSGYPSREIVFPANYHVFGFAQELYLVVNYSVNFHQWMAFGKSTVPGLPGSGAWCGATIGQPVASNGNYTSTEPISMSPTSGGYGYNQFGTVALMTAGALFWQGGVGNSYADRTTFERNAFVDHGLDSLNWQWNAPTTYGPIGQSALSPLLSILPSAWNSETVLLPFRAYLQRPSFKTSLIADLANARVIRLDFLGDGEIVTIGSDRWKCFPWYAKNQTERNCSNGISGKNHTGTLGWAILYEGP